jgi:hypothetical protein
MNEITKERSNKPDMKDWDDPTGNGTPLIMAQIRKGFLCEYLSSSDEKEENLLQRTFKIKW